MAFEERDPGDLKLRIVDLLLGHPQGVNFGDFSGAFYQLHGFHPHIYLYGYSSLRQLIADMKDLVVVECGSQTPVMKLVNGLNLDRWLEGEENGLQNPQEESQCLINGEQAEQLSVGLADVLAALHNLLTNYTSGLRITKLQEFLLASDGIDLEKVSIGQGYKDALEFLETQMPELNIHYREDRSNSVVKLPAGTSGPAPSPGPGFSACNRDVVTQRPMAKSPVGLADVLVALSSLLTDYKSGLMITKLQEFLLARDGVDLEKFSIGQGYMDTLMFLETQMPELNIHYQKDRLKCVVQLSADASTSSASSDIQNSVEEPPSRAPVLSDVVEKVTNLLAKYKFGLKIKKLQEFLLAGDGIDLKKFSISQGYMDTLEFLEAQMQELIIQYQEDRLSCVVQLLADITAAVTNLLDKYELGLKIRKVKKLLRTRDGIDLQKISISQGYMDTLEFLEAKMPELNIQYQGKRLNCVVQLPAVDPVDPVDLSDIVTAVTNLLVKYKSGLKIKKIQEFLLAADGIDLEKISISRGYKTMWKFLKAQMPDLILQHQGSLLKCIVQLPADSSVTSAASSIQNCVEGPAGRPPDSSVSSAASSIQNCVEGPTAQPPELSVAFFLIREVLKGQPHGLKVKKLKKALNKNCRFNLETFSSNLGYKDVMSCLQDMPGLLLRNITKPRNYVVQLESRACSPAPSLDSDFSACNSDTTSSGLKREEFGTTNLTPRPDFCASSADAVPQPPVAISPGACSPTPCPVPGFSACNTDTVPQKPVAKCSVGLADVLAALPNLLTNYKSGLRITKLQEFLLARDGIDLEKFSIGQGYKDTLEFLETQMPDLNIHYQEDRLKCVVQLSADASASSASSDIPNSVEEPPSQAPDGLSNILTAVTNLLAKYKSGLKIKKVQELLLAGDGIDLEKFSISQGYMDTLEFLEAQMQELIIQYQEDRLSSVVQLPAALLDIMAAVTNLLVKYKSGLKIKKVEKLLRTGDGIDLQKISISQGYTDTLEFLEAKMPELNIHYQENRLNCVVKLPADASPSSTSSDTQNSVEETASRAPDPVDPVDLSNIVTAVTNLLVKYKLGLKIKKVQEFLLAEDGTDLQKISISHGYKTMLQFLEAQMPELIVQRQDSLLKCVVQLSAGTRVGL
uniref:Uncharacterized protein isoform X3 n=1 Tax=Pogona vitticeps TaxID=103695 RepID=A0ABM5GSF4_9SAUR